ncbi:AP2 domain protein [Streptococcus pyogenes]|uniref:hypothetical protein n=1 Tax=Streptococcus pyogenes TaxID=1314 RepID=UPI0010CF5B85|nr:hypothetical protein [Streptococcus pyogenes]VGW59338.1 AP2 domain protein [Streptococcus pyogenes]VGX04577.1 AP2 domain protein [Streptococcus pyogenes]VGX38713.1 AP2 domain protein [Streptococcus pyogenes]VHI72524.1 AP2 domain protein [Streptococcus pyogenes]VHK97574.1 AP2 domain protein [Streptococcus pyogenes]
MKTTEIKEIGNVFNNLRVISYAGKNKHNKKLAFCECLLCGAKKNMILTEVRTGKSKSCGCLATIKAKERQMVHGYSGTKVYLKRIATIVKPTTIRQVLPESQKTLLKKGVILQCFMLIVNTSKLGLLTVR